MKKISVFLILLYSSVVLSQGQDKIELTIMPGEYWWAGVSSLGNQTPYDANAVVSIDLWGDNRGNQAQPLLLSTKGRYVWSEEPIKYEFNKGAITVSVRQGTILNGTAGTNLQTAYSHAAKTFFRQMV